MAYKRQYKKRGYRKKTQYRKKSRYGGRKYIKRKMKAQTRTVGIFMPDRYFTKLRYSYFKTVTDDNTLTPSRRSIEFRGNSLYDPDSSVGIGQNQPLGFDQLVQFYSRYRVYASKIVVRVHSLGATGTSPYYLAVIPYNTNTSFLSDNTLEKISEQPYSRYITRNQYDSNGYIKSVMSTAKIYGVPKTAVKVDDLYSSLVDNNPANQWAWMIAFGQLNPAVTTSTTYSMEIKITYYAEFYERKNLTRS